MAAYQERRAEPVAMRPLGADEIDFRGCDPDSPVTLSAHRFLPNEMFDQAMRQIINSFAIPMQLWAGSDHRQPDEG